jgi:hypothetical protein
VSEAKDNRDESGARPGGRGGGGIVTTPRCSHQWQQRQHEVGATQTPTPPPEPNQFVVLLYNLLLADIHQSMAFVLNAVWLARDGIEVGTATCWAQGWFVSTGDLASSLFITAIAIHTYLVAIRGWKPPQWAVVSTCVGLWVFDYLMVAVGIGVTGNGASGGGFYVRAAAWVRFFFSFFFPTLAHTLFPLPRLSLYD